MTIDDKQVVEIAPEGLDSEAAEGVSEDEDEAALTMEVEVVAGENIAHMIFLFLK